MYCLRLFIVVNPRRACAGGLRYLSCVCVCVSVTILASTSFVFTFQVRYIQLSFRLYSIFNSWIFDKTFRSQKLWHEKANMQINICLLRPPMVLIWRPFARIFDDRAF